MPWKKKVSIVMSPASPRTDDVEQILGPFKDMLRAVVDPDQLSENMRRVVQQTLQPRSLSLWLRTPITISSPRPRFDGASLSGRRRSRSRAVKGGWSRILAQTARLRPSPQKLLSLLLTRSLTTS